MLRYILLPVFFFLTYQINTLSWDSTAAKYYPLTIGNVWLYSNWRIQSVDTIFTGYYKSKIIYDTLINNKKYFVFDRIDSFTCASKYQRIDSVTMNVYSYRKDLNQEILIDSLSMRLNSTFRCKRNCYNPASAICLDTGQAPFSYRKIRADGTIYFEYRLDFNRGISHYMYAEGIRIGSTLRGCVINGILYGDTNIVGISNQNGIPKGFLLHQNYPNPFNPNTTITFEVPNKSELTIKLYNPEGRLIRILFNGTKSAGVYSLLLDGSNLASGVYFYSLEAEGFLQTKKLVIIK